MHLAGHARQCCSIRTDSRRGASAPLVQTATVAATACGAPATGKQKPAGKARLVRREATSIRAINRAHFPEQVVVWAVLASNRILLGLLRFM